MPSSKQQTTAGPKESSASQSTTVKSAAKKVTSTGKDGSVEEKVEPAKIKVGAPKAPTKGSSEDGVPRGKFVRRAVTAARDGPSISKDKRKKSSKATRTATSDAHSSLINGEAKIG